MSRRLLAVVVLALGWLAAFGPAPAVAQGPKVLRVATDTNLPWLDPHMGTAFTLRELSSHVFEGLVTIGEDYGVIPQLAESWSVSADGTEYTFKLRAWCQVPQRADRHRRGREGVRRPLRAVQRPARRPRRRARRRRRRPVDRPDLAEGGAGLVPRRPRQPGGAARHHAQGARDGRQGPAPAAPARRHRALPARRVGARPADHPQALRRLHAGPPDARLRARRGPRGPRGRGPHHLHRARARPGSPGWSAAISTTRWRSRRRPTSGFAPRRPSTPSC